jgi:hypothetical protein
MYTEAKLKYFPAYRAALVISTKSIHNEVIS